MKKMKKVIALLLAMCMLAAICVGCGQKDPVSGTEQASGSGTEEGSGASESEAKEIFTIKHVSLNGATYTDHFNNYVKDSAVYKELVKQTSCEIEEIGLDNDQASIRITNGDLGDMMKLYGTSNVDLLIESDKLLPLDDLIAQYAPELLEDLAGPLSYAKEYGNGHIYFIPINMGTSALASDVVARNLYSVRWDLYKALGYPEMKNPDDLVKVLTDMVALEPKTSEGKPVYGASFYVTNTSFFGMVACFEGTYGWTDIKGHYVMKDKNDEIVYSMIDEEGPYWWAVDFYNKAYRAGILDPDSFTQQVADYNAKIESGQILCNIYSGKSYNAKQIANDPNTIKGFVEVPVEGTMVYGGGYVPYGSKDSNSIAIPKSCSNPQRVMEFIAYVLSEDGSRMLMSGVQGVHWDYVNGVPTYNAETAAIIRNGGEEYYKTGIRQDPLQYMIAYEGGVLHSDGYPIDLKVSKEYKASMEYLPVQKDFSKYYGVDYPVQIFEKYIAEGKIYDTSVYDERISLGTMDEETQRIDAKCLSIALEAIPKLVKAADQATFDSIKAETLAELKKAGAETAKAAYVKQWNEAKAKVAAK